MSADGHRTKWRRNIAKYFNRLSRVHERYRQTDRQTEGRRPIANVNVSSRSLKINEGPKEKLGPTICSRFKFAFYAHIISIWTRLSSSEGLHVYRTQQSTQSTKTASGAIWRLNVKINETAL